MEKAIIIIYEEIVRLGGKIFADFALRHSENDEVKKAVQSNDFMLALMTGKNIKEEWGLEKNEDYKTLLELDLAIKKLQDKP